MEIFSNPLFATYSVYARNASCSDGDLPVMLFTVVVPYAEYPTFPVCFALMTWKTLQCFLF